MKKKTCYRNESLPWLRAAAACTGPADRSAWLLLCRFGRKRATEGTRRAATAAGAKQQSWWAPSLFLNPGRFRKPARFMYLLLLLISFTATAQTELEQPELEQHKLEQHKLEQLQQRAAEENPQVLSAYKAFEVALQQAAQAGKLPEPVLGAAVAVSPIQTRVGPQLWRVSLAQQFPWFGTLAVQKKQQGLLAEAAYQQYVQQRLKSDFAVAAAWLPLYETQQWLAANQEQQVLLESYKQLALSKFENNQGSLADVLLVELRVQELQSEQQILQLKQVQQRQVVQSYFSEDFVLPALEEAVSLSEEAGRLGKEAQAGRLRG